MDTDKTPQANAAPKLYVERGCGSKQTYWTNPETAARLKRVRRRYAELMGRDVSRSIIVRRAVELLEDRLRNVSDEADVIRERSAILEQLR